MIRQRSRPMPTSVAQGFRSMRPMTPTDKIQAIQRMQQAQGAPIPNAPGGGLAAMSPEQLKALQDRQKAFQERAALSFMQGTPMPAGTALKKGGMVKKASKVSSASKRADGCSTKGKTKGRMV